MNAYDAARTEAAFARLDGFKSLVLSGPDRARFLHGQVSCPVEGLGIGQSVRGCYLTPKGRLIAEFALFNRGEALVLLAPDGAFEALRDGLGRTIALARAEMTVPETSRATLALVGPNAKGLLQRLPDLSRVDVIALPWAGLPGGWVHGDSAVVGALADALDGVPELDATQCEILRVENGVPAWGVDMDGDNFPLEVRLEDAVSFEKGCYMGQETLAHIKNRGRLNRRLVGLKLERTVEAGTEVTASAAPIGRVTSVVESPRLGTALALALVKDEAAAPGAHLEAGGARATLQEFPL